MFQLTQLHIIYLLVGLSAALAAEAIYLLVFTRASYRKHINHRLCITDGVADRGSVLVKLRRERGLTGSGEYRLPLVNLNQLLLQSGLTIGFRRGVLLVALFAATAFAAMAMTGRPLTHATIAGGFCLVPLPLLALKVLRGRRRKKFGAQFPDAIDIIVRSLRAGHPVPIAITMVAREMPDPVGSEFGIVAD
ncbi:MAG: type II secretion system protein F, partial [Pseudolabrys sp.]|nr:type II secretion system protein F [Pseudolabrys sp.]